MKNWNKPHATDAGLAKAYRSRPHGCTCEITVEEIFGGNYTLLRRDYVMSYSRDCPFHFPELHRAREEGA